jgi:RHS repeat-associated protein
VASETSTLGTSKTYTYDPAGQITSDGAHSYTWDKEGNNAASGWTTTTGNELTTDGTWNYSYDNAGNETQKTNISNGQVWLYYYDNANRLVKAEHKPSSGGSVDERILFSYDVFGNRIKQDVDPTGGGTYTTTKYAYDPNGNAWADLSSGGTLQIRRLYADAMDALYAKIGSGGVNWMLPDLVGSIRDITNSSGSLIDHRDWDPFGNLTYESSSGNGDRYGYTGREWSTELSLQYNRARWYDPATKRWMSQDPLGFDAGDSNLYRYVFNSPQCNVDPSGKDIWVEGPSGSEPWGHRSLCIGDPNGEYKSYSFGSVSGAGWDLRAWVGAVYEDTEKGGAIISDYYLKCSPETDKKLQAKYDNMIGDEDWYVPCVNTCRDWTYGQFEAIEDDLGDDVKHVDPPDRVPKGNPGGALRITTTTTTTTTAAAIVTSKK